MGEHSFTLVQGKPKNSYPKGFRADATVKQFPALKNLGISFLRLEVGGMREPHWHPNAHELNYCLSGQALITLFGPHNRHETFLLNPGDVSFVPMGVLHYIENLGKEPLEMLVCFSNESYEDLSLTQGVSAFSNLLLGRTFKKSEMFFEGLEKSKNGVFITSMKKQTAPLPSQSTNFFKFMLEKKNPEVRTPGGEVRMCTRGCFEATEGLSIYSLILNEGGIREPHWHPNANELNYLIRGSVKITLVSPKGSIETFKMHAGDISFLPQGYLHHIENIGSSRAHLAVFFSHSFPSDIGITGCLGAYSNDVLGSLFNVAPSYFKAFPKYQEDLLVVGGG